MEKQLPNDEPYALIPASLAKEMIDAFRMLKAAGAVNPGYQIKQIERLPNDMEPTIRFRNNSGETIPGYACMQITSVHNETDELTVLGAEKPVDTDGTAGSYLFNGPYEVEDGEIGCAQKYRRVYAKKSTGTATAGERWSPIIGEWTIEQDDAGPFVMAGDDLLDTNVVMVFIDGSGSNAGSIEYEIVSITIPESGPYTGLVVATVTVKGASCGLGNLIGDEVDVVDHSECIFDLVEGDLVGLWGWADRKVFPSLDTEAEEGELTPCHWSATNRCCAASEM